MAHSVESLPKWAQQVIGRQEGTIRELRENIQILQGQQGKTGVYQVVNYGFGSGERAILHLTDAEVMFTLSHPTKSDWPDVEIGVRRGTDEKGRAHLAVNSRCGMSVVPHVSNVVRIRPEET